MSNTNLSMYCYIQTADIQEASSNDAIPILVQTLEITPESLAWGNARLTMLGKQHLVELYACHNGEKLWLA
jgi:hypothetical protein